MRVLDVHESIYEARVGDHVELLVEVGGSTLSHAVATVTSDKALAKSLLAAAGLSVPVGVEVRAGDADAALQAAQELGFPLVVKPVFGTNGGHVHMGLQTLVEVREALLEIVRDRGANERVLLEEEFRGVEHRVLMTKDGDYAVIRRDPPFVVGDGARSVAQLCADESHRRTHPRRNCLGVIVTDEEATRCLGRYGMTLDSVPAAGERVWVRANSNLSTGGSAEDVTDDVHPSVVELARRALAAFPGLAVAGLDYMTTDVTAPQSQTGHRFLEVNPLPGIGMHLAPGAGPSRDVARCIAELVFPELRAGDRPPGARPVVTRFAPPPEADNTIDASSNPQEEPVSTAHHPIVDTCFAALTESKTGEPFTLTDAGAATIAAAVGALKTTEDVTAAVLSIVQLSQFLSGQHRSPTAAKALLATTASVATKTLAKNAGGTAALAQLQASADRMKQFEGDDTSSFRPASAAKAGQAKAGPMARFAFGDDVTSSGVKKPK